MRRLLLSILLVLCIVFPQTAFATADISITSDDNIREGDTFTMIVSFSGPNIDRAVAELKYDTEKLSYISGGTSNGDGGTVALSGASSSGKYVSFSLEFCAVQAGTSSVTCQSLEMYNLDGNMIENAKLTREIEISAAAGEADNPSQEENVKVIETPEIEEDDMDSVRPFIRFDTVLIAVTALVLVILILAAIRRRRDT